MGGYDVFVDAQISQNYMFYTCFYVLKPKKRIGYTSEAQKKTGLHFWRCLLQFPRNGLD